MKLSEYKTLLDLSSDLTASAEAYFKKVNLPFDSVKVLAVQPTFIVVARVVGGREYPQSVSVWALIEDKPKSG